MIDWIEAQVGPVAKPSCNARPEPSADPIEVGVGEIGSTVVRPGDPDPSEGVVSYAIVSDPALAALLNEPRVM